MTDEEAPVLQGLRVLVVEDAYFIADDLRRALAGLGAEVIGPVPTQEEALARLGGEGRIDLAVLDINLRDGMASEVADALAAQGVPFVFATGYDRSSTPAGHAAVPLWQKPYDAQALLRSLPHLARR